MKKFLAFLSFVMISLAQVANAALNVEDIKTEEMLSKQSKELAKNTPQETNIAQDLKDTQTNEIWQKLEDIKQINTINDEQREFIFNKYYDYYKYKPKKYDTPFKDTGFFHKNIKQVVGKKYNDSDFLFYVYGFGEAAGSFDYFITSNKKLDESRKNAVREGNDTFYTIKDDTKEVFLECMKEKFRQNKGRKT